MALAAGPGGYDCEDAVSKIAWYINLIVIKQINLYLDVLRLPWYDRVDGLPGTIIGHQDFIRHQQEALKNYLKGFDKGPCRGDFNNAVSDIGWEVADMPVAIPLTRGVPPQGQNWATPVYVPGDGLLPAPRLTVPSLQNFLQELFGPGGDLELVME